MHEVILSSNIVSDQATLVGYRLPKCHWVDKCVNVMFPPYYQAGQGQSC